MGILISLLTVVATFAGGALALRSRDRMHIVLGLSGGLLLGLVGFDLIPEIFEAELAEFNHVPVVAILFVTGFLILHVFERAVGSHEPVDSEYGHDHDHHSATGLIGALAMVVHVFLDGVAVALAFSVSTALGIAVAIAVVAHAFSDGLNTVALLIRSGNWKKRAVALLSLDGISRVSGAVLGTYVSFSTDFVTYYLALFAGFLTYLATSHILPEAHSKHPSRLTLLATIAGVLIMLLIVVVGHGAH
ncbi:MAG: hypothetical protein RLZZ426_1159 [Actinomycetota bacterium]|jgi:ZIP family zinc transporter